MAWRCAEQKKMDFWAKVTQSLYWPYMYHLWFYIPQTNSLALLKSRSRNCTCILQMGFILCKRYASFLLSAFSIFFLLFLLIKGLHFTTNICCSGIVLQKIMNALSEDFQVEGEGVNCECHGLGEIRTNVQMRGSIPDICHFQFHPQEIRTNV